MEIIGHKKIINFLAGSIKNNRLAHSYLFYGPAHIGKNLLASTLAASLVYQQKPNFESLSESEVKEKFHSDIIRIVPESGKEKISIDQIRDLKEQLSLTPFSKRYKIAIIEEAEKLTQEAGNSFLKLLEETPKKSIIILLAKNLKAILPTIYSRCLILRFSLPTQSEITDYFKKKCLDPVQINKLYHLALGRPGLIFTYLNHPQILEAKRQEAGNFLSFLADSDNIALGFDLAGRAKGESLLTWLQVIRDLILKQLDLPVSGLLPESNIKGVTKKYSFKNLSRIAKQIILTQDYLSHYVNRQLALENLLINLN